MIVTSTMLGTLVRWVRPTASRAPAISLRALFLAPTTDTRPRGWRHPSPGTVPAPDHRSDPGAAAVSRVPGGTLSPWSTSRGSTRAPATTARRASVTSAEPRRTTHALVAYADTNEANAQIGVAIAVGGLDDEVTATPTRVQNDLFDVGADLCNPLQATYEYAPLRVLQPWVDDLEADCDRYLERVEPLRSFILPGGRPVPHPSTSRRRWSGGGAQRLGGDRHPRRPARYREGLGGSTG